MTGRWHRVRVHWPDGRTHDDAIRGRTAGEAIDNAIANWITETPYARAARVEYLSGSAAGAVTDDATPDP